MIDCIIYDSNGQALILPEHRHVSTEDITTYRKKLCEKLDVKPCRGCGRPNYNHETAEYCLPCQYSSSAFVPDIDDMVVDLWYEQNNDHLDIMLPTSVSVA